MKDLHIHLGGAVPSSVLWEILCDNGLQTEFESFGIFHDSLTASQGQVKSLDDFLGRYFEVTEEIQSSPSAASVSAYQVVAKAYRRARITAVELRFNPIKRVRKGLHTMDAIILAVIQGLERASLHYGVHTGMVLSLGRDISLESNWEIVEAAIKWRSRGELNGAYGVVGIDMAGLESKALEMKPVWLKEVAAMFDHARKAGLKTTYHVGETAATGPQGMLNVVDYVKPDRIGHGIELRNAEGKVSEELWARLVEDQVCLEICPTVNLVTRSISSYSDLSDLVRKVADKNVPFCINTDNPYLIHTNLRKEHDIMEEHLGVDGKTLIDMSQKHADQHTFLKGLRV